MTRGRRLAGLLGGVALLALLAACSPDGTPIPVEPGMGTGDDPRPTEASAECQKAFPGAAGTGEIADADGILPPEWPDPPFGAELCVVMVPNDVNAILQYVSSRQDVYAVLDHYEVALQDLAYAGWVFERSEGIADQPILNVTGPELEFAIQTDAATGTYVVGFEVLTS